MNVSACDKGVVILRAQLATMCIWHERKGHFTEGGMGQAAVWRYPRMEGVNAGCSVRVPSAACHAGSACELNFHIMAVAPTPMLHPLQLQVHRTWGKSLGRALLGAGWLEPTLQRFSPHSWPALPYPHCS